MENEGGGERRLSLRLSVNMGAEPFCISDKVFKFLGGLVYGGVPQEDGAEDSPCIDFLRGEITTFDWDDLLPPQHRWELPGN